MLNLHTHSHRCSCFLVLALAAFPLAAFAEDEITPATARVRMAQEEAAVRAADLALNEALAQADVDRFRALLDADCVFLGANANRGPDEVAKGWSVFFREEGRWTLSWAPEAAGVAAAGDLAWTVGPGVLKPPAGADVGFTERPARYLTIWRKDAEGRWRVLFDGSQVISTDPAIGRLRGSSDALRELWEPARDLAAELDWSWRPETTYRSASDDLSVVFGSFTVQARSDGGEQETDGFYYTVMREDPDAEGVWTTLAGSMIVLPPPAP